MQGRNRRARNDCGICDRSVRYVYSGNAFRILVRNGGGEVKLNAEEKRICKKYSKPDKNGVVHCKECPMAINTYYCVCKKNITKKEYERAWA